MPPASNRMSMPFNPSRVAAKSVTGKLTDNSFRSTPRPPRLTPPSTEMDKVRSASTHPTPSFCSEMGPNDCSTLNEIGLSVGLRSASYSVAWNVSWASRAADAENLVRAGGNLDPAGTVASDLDEIRLSATGLDDAVFAPRVASRGSSRSSMRIAAPNPKVSPNERYRRGWTPANWKPLAFTSPLGPSLE